MSAQRRFTILFLILLQAAVAVDAFGQTAPKPGASPAPAADLLSRGINNFNIGNYEEAFDDLSRVREQAPQSATAAFYLGATLKKMQQYDQAIPPLMAAVTIQPPEKQAYLVLADTYYATGQLDLALRTLAMAEKENIDPGQTTLLRGLVLLKEQKYREALAAFEETKKRDPKLALTADFQTAAAYQQMGQLTDALALYRDVTTKEPDSDVGYMAKQQADALAQRIASRKAFTGAANLQEQFDSNVLLKPDSFPTGSISGQSDRATVLSLQAEYSPEMRFPYGLKFQYSGYLSAYAKLHAYDTQSHTLGVVPSFRRGADTLTVPITVNYTTLDNAKYLQAYTLAPAYSFPTGEDQYAQASVIFAKKDYLQEPAFPEENQDATDTGFSLSWQRLIAQQKGFLSFKYELTKEHATGANWSYLGNKLDASVLYPAGEKMKFNLALEADRLDFDNVHSVYGIKRADTTSQANAQALYALTAAVDGQLQYVWTKNDSNVPVYAYHKTIISIGVVARF
jgi:tetratricopeptide (TPR) repeat protein